MGQVRAGFQPCYQLPEMAVPFLKKTGFTFCDQVACSLFAGCLFGNYGIKNCEGFSWKNFISQNVVDELRSADMLGTITFSELTNFPELVANQPIEDAVRWAQRKKGLIICFRLGEKEDALCINSSSEKKGG